jgi:cold shock CspA family protein
MRGQVKFYDATTAWGLVLGDDGKLYGVTGARPPDAAALTEGEYVLFEPQAAPGGPRAAAVRRLRASEGGRVNGT